MSITNGCRELEGMYNPAKSPYVSHAEGIRLVIEFIEKFWCPTISSTDIQSGTLEIGVG